MIDYSEFLVAARREVGELAELMRVGKFEEAKQKLLDARSNLAKIHAWILVNGIENLRT